MAFDEPVATNAASYWGIAAAVEPPLGFALATLVAQDRLLRSLVMSHLTSASASQHQAEARTL
jgi:hypothetical protein